MSQSLALRQRTVEFMLSSVSAGDGRRELRDASQEPQTRRECRTRRVDSETRRGEVSCVALHLIPICHLRNFCKEKSSNQRRPKIAHGEMLQFCRFSVITTASVDFAVVKSTE